MAIKNVSTPAEEGKGLPEWQQERIKVTCLVQEHILTPLMVFSELVSGYHHDGGRHVFEIEELTSLLNLVVMGARMEMKVYCVRSGGAHTSWLPQDYLDTIESEWEQAISVMKGGAE